MEVRPGYEQTEVGVVPSAWDVKPLAKFVALQRGHDLTERDRRQGEVPVMGSAGPNGFHDTALVRAPGVILGRSGASFGQAHYCNTDFWPHNTALYVTDFLGSHPLFAFYFLQGIDFRRYNSGGAQQSLNRNFIAPILVAVPQRKEQEVIAEALSDADGLIESLERLLTKKRQLKQAAMQELLTGTKRLPRFRGEWTVKRIAEIAFPSSEKNVSCESLPVLTCSKHLGFVDSLAYFKNQVFSKDTSAYRVITRGQIGYPSNHVEEGSIGLQDLYDVALVSPIYVVFSVTEGVDSYFLHRLLKLDSYRHAFATATSSSVARRGSLRWPAFSEITVNLPRFEEQEAVADVLRDMEAEITALAAKLAKARALKQGMMQELLIGRIRLI